MNLSTLKKEAIEQFPQAAFAGETTNYDSKGVQMFIDELLDKVVEACEESVVPEEALPSDWDDDDKPRMRASMYNTCREHILEAFTNFKK